MVGSTLICTGAMLFSCFIVLFPISFFNGENSPGDKRRERLLMFKMLIAGITFMIFGGIL